MPFELDLRRALFVAASLAVGCSTLLGVDFGAAKLRDASVTGPCESQSCMQRGFVCGTQDDGCGKVIECGNCPNSGECNFGRCDCTKTTCPKLGATCGAQNDACGGTLDCGKCPGQFDACIDGKCACQPQTCQKQGIECGGIPDGCGNTYFCGQCMDVSKPYCNMGKCTITPCTPNTSCTNRCGTVSDGCGGLVNCPTTCANSYDTCGGGGMSNVCGCTATTCMKLGKDCGSVGDGCAGMLMCGSCTMPDTCGGGGTPNVCGCTPLKNCPMGACGAYPDGCGGNLNCGGCNAPETCGGGGVMNKCGCTPTMCSACCGSGTNDCGGQCSDVSCCSDM